MSATHVTTHYSLNQWEATDPVSRRDFNADNLTLDTALAALSTAVGQRAAIVTGTYTGSGGFGSGSPNTLTLGFAPKLLLIMNNAGTGATMTVIIPGAYSFGFTPADATANTAEIAAGPALLHRMRTYLSGTTVSWYSAVSAAMQMNTQGTVYYYVAVG